MPYNSKLFPASKSVDTSKFSYRFVSLRIDPTHKEDAQIKADAFLRQPPRRRKSVAFSPFSFLLPSLSPLRPLPKPPSSHLLFFKSRMLLPPPLLRVLPRPTLLRFKLFLGYGLSCLKPGEMADVVLLVLILEKLGFCL